MLVKRTPDEVPSAASGKVRMFFDESGRLALKDESGKVVTPQSLIAALEALVATKQDASSAATDTELSNAVSTLNAAISTKQDASTAATDAELASAVSTINAALATKQDASTAATSSDLDAAVDGLEEAIGKKQDSSTAATDAELASGLATKQSLSEKGQANGYPTLDNAGHVPASQMPVGALTYKGTWDASTNTPAVSDGTGKVGEQYFVSVGGERDLGSGKVKFVAGSIILHNGTVWQQLASPNAVTSVFGRQGAVAPQAGDYVIADISGLTAALAGLQPLDADLTAIAALSTTKFGRELLELASAAAARSTLGLGSAALAAVGAAEEAGKVLAADDATLATLIAAADEVGKGAAPEGYAYGKIKAELNAEEIGVDRIWFGRGAGKAPLAVNTDGTPASGSITDVAQFGAALIDAAAVNPSLRSLNTDGTMAEASDTQVASRKAVKTYADAQVKAERERAEAAEATAAPVSAVTTEIFTLKETTGLKDIPLLALAISKSVTEVWRLSLWVLLETANNAMDFKHGFTVPAGCTMRWGSLPGNSGNQAGFGIAPTATTPLAMLSAAETLAGGTRSGVIGVPLVAIVYGGGTAGNVQLQVAQNTSDAGNLSVLPGSIMEARKVRA
jgi:hypothetical protein